MRSLSLSPIIRKLLLMVSPWRAQGRLSRTILASFDEIKTSGKYFSPGKNRQALIGVYACLTPPVCCATMTFPTVTYHGGSLWPG